MKWLIEYYSDRVAKLILEFPPGLLARYLRFIDLMVEFGPNLGAPHTKFVERDLYELRIKGREGIARVFYTVCGERIVILHSYIKKTDRIPGKELRIARKRMREVHDSEA